MRMQVASRSSVDPVQFSCIFIVFQNCNSSNRSTERLNCYSSAFSELVHCKETELTHITKHRVLKILVISLQLVQWDWFQLPVKLDPPINMQVTWFNCLRNGSIEYGWYFPKRWRRCWMTGMIQDARKWRRIWIEESIEALETNVSCHVVCRSPPHWSITETIKAVALSVFNDADSCDLKRISVPNQWPQ